jgi:uncharacterized protein YlxW (UPF0749 family)
MNNSRHRDMIQTDSTELSGVKIISEKRIRSQGTCNTRIERCLLAAMLFIIGIILAVQMRDEITFHNKIASSKENTQYYQIKFDELTDENKRLKEENLTLYEHKDSMTENILREQGYDELAVLFAEARRLAGLTTITGDGVSVTMNDSSISDTSDINQTSLIHAQDVQYVVDLLKTAGAEAIAINGERIIYTTSISCTGPTIRVNNNRYTVPFVITAVCDSDATYDILQNDPYLQYRMTSTVEITFDVVQQITISAFTDLSEVDKIYEGLQAGVSS